MQRIKAPRYKLLNEALVNAKCGKHEAKQGNQQGRAKAKRKDVERIKEELYD